MDGTGVLTDGTGVLTGGVHVLMLDGSGHFVSDTVNLDIWHRMHKRDNKDVFELPF